MVWVAWKFRRNRPRSRLTANSPLHHPEGRVAVPPGSTAISLAADQGCSIVDV